jgi:hypothetical protein
MSSDKIVKFYKKNAAESADSVLEQAIGIYDEVVILGWDKNGNIDARANLKMKSRDVLWLIEVFKTKLLRGDYSDDE